MPAEMGSLQSRVAALLWKYKLLFFQLFLSIGLTVFFYTIPPGKLPKLLTTFISPASLKTFSFGLFCALVTRARATLGQIIGRNARYFQEKYGLYAGRRRTQHQHAILDLIAFLNQIEKVDSREERQVVHDIIGFQDVTGTIINVDEERSTLESALLREIKNNPHDFLVCEASSECLRCILVIRNSKDHYLVTELDHVFRVKGLQIPAAVIGSKLLLAGELSIDHRPSGYALHFEILRDLPIKGLWQTEHVVEKLLEAKQEARSRGDDVTNSRRSEEPFSLGRKLLGKLTDINRKPGGDFLPHGGNGSGTGYFIVHKDISQVHGTQASLWKGREKAHVQEALRGLL